MKKFFLIALAVLASAIGIFAIVVAMQPSDFRVTRSATMAAPPERVFEQVNSFHKWQTWSPWTELDPDAKVTFEGPESGKDAKFAWAGNANVGEGSMTITDSHPSDLIRIRLDFLKPMEGTSDVEFTFKPQGDQTAVAWTMTGKNSFMGRAICMFMNMDEMVGGMYEQGLANIKKIVEKPAPTPAG